MKNIYETPAVEISVIETDDVIMISALDVKQSGNLNTVDWNDIA